MKKENEQLVKGLAFLSPWIIGFTVFTLLPLAFSFYFSFCKFDLLKPPRFIGMQNYSQMVSDNTFWQATGNTMKFGALSLPACLFVSLGLAILLNVRIPGLPVWRAIIFLPSLVPLFASAMIWMSMFNSKVGLINAMLEALNGWLSVLSHIGIHLHIPLPSWLADPFWAIPALALMSVWGVGNAVVIYLAGLQDIPRELYEAAELDGAGPLQRLMNVTIPMLSPVIFYNLIIGIIGTLQYFDMPYIMMQVAGLGPAHSAYMLSLYVYDNSFNYLHMGYACALAWVLLLIVLALTALAFWTSKRWVYYQGK